MQFYCTNSDIETHVALMTTGLDGDSDHEATSSSSASSLDQQLPAEPPQALPPVRIRQAGDLQDATSHHVKTPRRAEAFLAESLSVHSPDSYAVFNWSEDEQENLGSFAVDCSEFEVKEFSSYPVDCTDHNAEELSSQPIKNVESKMDLPHPAEDCCQPVIAELESYAPHFDEEVDEEIQLEHEESIADNFSSNSSSSQHKR